MSLDQVHNCVLKEFSLEIKLTQNEKNLARHIITIFLCANLFFGLLAPAQLAYATATFGSEINLSNSAVGSLDPQIVATGSNVYVVWQEDSPADIFFNSSSNSGSSFITGTKNLSDDSTDSIQVKITATGNDVYVVWVNDTTIDDVHIAVSNNGGTDFTTTNLSQDGVNPAQPRVAAVGSNVYLAWQNETSTGIFDIVFRNSTDSGATFSPSLSSNATNLSSDSQTSIDPDLVAVGTNVYVVWQNDTSSTSDIYIAASTDSGVTFPTTTNISDDSFKALKPKAAAVGNNVYVAWRNDSSTDNIGFARSTNNGVSFSTPIEISSTVGTLATNIDMAAIGSNVYVVWNDNSVSNFETFLAVSTDSGANFGSPINLSDNSGFSFEPKVNATGTNAYVTWRDNTAGNNEILFKSITDNGQTICGSSTNLSSNSGSSDNQQVASAGSNVYVTWNDATGNTDILFKAGSTISSCIEFDKTEYRISEAATITVTRPDLNTDSGTAETIDGGVTSTSDGIGISLTVTETGLDTGIFTGTMTFTTGSTLGSTLKVAKGDTITASFGGQTGTASIFAVSFSYSATGPTLSTIITITITDQNSNTDSGTAETIAVTASSDTDPTGIPLTLTETGVNTGVFTHTGLIFMTGNDLFPFSGTITLQLTEPLSSNVQNADTGAVDFITMSIASTSDPSPGGISPTLTETGINTGVFKAKITFTSGTSSGNSLEAAPGDIISLSFEDETSKGLITPNPDAGLGALQVAISNDITVTFGADSNSDVTIVVGTGGGGGGGGLVRPSLVLDIIASLASGGGGAAAPVVTLNDLRFSSFIDLPDEIEQVVINFDPFTPLEPFDVTAEQFETFDFPLSIDNDGYALSGHTNTINTKTLYTGEATKIKTVFYMPLEVEHVAFYTNMREGDSLDDSDTFLRFWKSESTQFEIKDENGFFEYINLTLEQNGIKKIATFDMKFLKPMEKSDIVLRMWDEKLHSTTILIFDAIEVVESENADLKKHRRNRIKLNRWFL